MSTSLNDLPNDDKKDNIIINEVIQPNIEPINNTPIKLDQNTINQLITGIQLASNATKLPSRDIDTNTIHLTQDIETQPNYIPKLNKENYIDNELTKEDIIEKYNKNKKSEKTIDDFYDDFNEPLLICLLYFIFQLPFFKIFLQKHIPILFHNDYNFNIYGLIFSSIFFTMIFHLLKLALKQFDKF